MQHNKFLIDFGLKFNYRRRELPWYGLWGNVVRIFEGNHNCITFPQFALWNIELSPTPEPVDADPKQPKTPTRVNDPDSIYYHGFDGNTALRTILSAVSSPPGTLPSTSPESPLAGRGVNRPDVYVPRSLHRDIKEEGHMAVIDEHHKVTDFAVVQLLTNKDTLFEYVVPVLAEIKRYCS